MGASLVSELNVPSCRAKGLTVVASVALNVMKNGRTVDDVSQRAANATGTRLSRASNRSSNRNNKRRRQAHLSCALSSTRRR